MKSYLKDLSTRLVRNSVIENRYEDDGRYFQTYKWLHNDNFESDKFLHLLRWKIKPSDVYRKLTSGIKFEPEGIALDLGCALGLSTLELANKFSFVFGIDSSFSFMVEAKKKSSDAGYTNIEFFVCDILDNDCDTGDYWESRLTVRTDEKTFHTFILVISLVN